jgi:hypothetical protein
MIVTLRELTTSYPDYWFGWLVHADVLTHFGGLLGVPQAAAMAAFERAVTLNPRLLPAWEHYAWLALLQRDTAAMTRALDGLSRFDARAAAADFGWDQVTSLMLTDRLLRGDSAGAAPLWRAHVADLAARADPSFGADALERHGLAEEQIRLTREVLAAGPPVAAIPAHHQALVHAFIRRGAWDSALALVEQTGAGQLHDAAARGYRLAVLAAWLGALPPSAAAGHRARARESAGANPLAMAELAWLDGVLALARGDTAGSAAAIAALEADSAANAALLLRSLTALRAGAAGDVAGAARRLASLEWERAEHGYADAEPHPLVTVVDRLAAGRWLRETGGLDEAIRLLRWTEGAYTLYPGAAESVGAATIVEYELGRVAEAAGAIDEAVRRYREFVRLYDLPPPAHRPMVAHARGFVERYFTAAAAGPS